MTQKEPFAALLADLPDVMNAKQAALALGVNRRTLDRLAAAGRLRKIKLSPSKTGAARFLTADLLKLLEQGAA